MGGNAMMIADTHVLIWLLCEPKRLSARANKAICEADHLGFSDISLWEIAMLHQKGRIYINEPLNQWFEDICQDTFFKLISISPGIASRSGKLEMHGDPADRIIVATALQHGIPLITADNRITETGLVPVVW
ncbi:MAG: type II toxin-antitoxin system VapC family toxin [Thermoguttaceae bacterium]